MNGSFTAKSGGFSSSRQSNRFPGTFSNNFARNSNSGRSGSGASSSGRNFGGGFNPTRSVAPGSRSAMGQWQSFGNSAGRSMLASTHSSGNFASAGWHSFGSVGSGHGAAMSRVFRNGARSDPQWRSFGNSGNAAFARGNSEFASFGGSRASVSNFHSARINFSDRFSNNIGRTSRFSSFSSFSREPSFGAFGFAGSGFGGGNFANASIGSGFGGGGIGAGLSLIPNLLSGFLNGGASLFGGPGALAANAISLAVRLFVSSISSGDSAQGGYGGGDAESGSNGFSGNFGFAAAPVWPACGPGATLWTASPAPATYCGRSAYAYRPFGWSSPGYSAGPAIGFAFQR
jgi:hypothetical protein